MISGDRSFINRIFLRLPGALVYYLSKGIIVGINLHRKKTPIAPALIGRLRIFFPRLELGRVRIVHRAVLPSNWFMRHNRTLAMTFGWGIYTPLENMTEDYEGMLLLIHELNHVAQIRVLSEIRFAGRYGEELCRYGYAAMPLEKEAYDFVASIPFHAAFYLRTYPDVQAAAKGSPAGAFAHWLEAGIVEGRDSTPFFNARKYLENLANKDLSEMIGAGNYQAAVLHWIRSGRTEGRKGN